MLVEGANGREANAAFFCIETISIHAIHVDMIGLSMADDVSDMETLSASVALCKRIRRISLKKRPVMYM